MDKAVLTFIEEHKLDPDDFFDAQGQPAKSCYAIMKEKEKLFAYNTTACAAGGHKIRDRHGHCVVCDPKTIAFSLRKKKVGYVYIACSQKKEFTKVGMTTENPKTRLSKLNSRRVGNTDDWEMVFTLKAKKAHSIELNTHGKLKKYRVQGEVYGNTETMEVFRCSFQKAKQALDETVSSSEEKIAEQNFYVSKTEKYNFRNLISS